MSHVPRVIPSFLAVAICLAAPAEALNNHWKPAGYGGSGLFPVVAIDPTPGTDTVYLGSDVAGVYKSTDGGESWQSFRSGLISLQIASLAIDPSDPLRVWAGTPLGLHLSEDGGVTWTVVDRSIHSYKHIDNRGIAISPDGRTLLVTHHDLEGEPEDGTYSGTLFRSPDGGGTWSDITGDLPILRVRRVAYDTNALWAATWCAGTYRLDLTTSCTEPSIQGQPEDATVPAGGTVTLSVDANGTAPLAYRWYRGAAGDASVPIDGADEASFTTGPLTETGRFWVRVTNDCGSIDSTTATITVATGCTEPSIVTQPSSLIISEGETATLAVSAAGTATLAYQWYWGESSRDDDPVENAASAQMTTDPLTESEDFWVRVTNECGSIDSATATVLVAPATGPSVAVIPAVAHSPGAGGTTWRTDVALINPGATEMPVAFRFYPRSGLPSQLVARWLGPGATVEFGNIMESLFGWAPADVAAGSLTVTSTGPVIAGSRTFNQTPGGTFGQFLPALTDGQSLAAGHTGYLPQIKRNEAFRTNVGLVNLGAGPATVAIRLFDETGLAIGRVKNMTVEENRWRQQFDIFAATGAGDVDIGYATVEVETAGGLVWVYASIVDNATGDGTTIPVLVP